MYLTDIPPLVEYVVGRLTTISRMWEANHSKLENLHLPDSLSPSPNNTNDLLSLVQYSNLYARAWGNNTTNKMWSEIKMEHYELFYLTEFSTVDIFTKNYMENYAFCSMDNYKVW